LYLVALGPRRKKKMQDKRISPENAKAALEALTLIQTHDMADPVDYRNPREMCLLDFSRPDLAETVRTILQQVSQQAATTSTQPLSDKPVEEGENGSEVYPAGWHRVVLMVSPDGQRIHAIGGDNTSPDGCEGCAIPAWI
jgi:hypothetical protein